MRHPFFSERSVSVFYAAFTEDMDHFRSEGSGPRNIKGILRFLPYCRLELIAVEADRLLIGITEKSKQQ